MLLRWTVLDWAEGESYTKKKFSKMVNLSKDKLFLLFFGALFLLLGLRTFSNNVLNKDKLVETKAIIVSKYHLDLRGYRGQRSDKSGYRIAYIYAYDRETALKYRSGESLDRRLNIDQTFRNVESFDTSQYADQIDLSSMVLGTRPLDLQTYRSLTVGQEILIEYREDIPWQNEVTYWSVPFH